MEKAFLNHAIIELTSDCNLRCKHCYNWWKQEGMNMERLGSFRKAYLLLDYLIRKTTLSKVVFTGGEPTISERFIELVLHAKVNGVRVIVITNGNGEIKVYEQLAALQVNLMEFSILSFRPEIHDRITGVPGAWEKMMLSLQLILGRGIEVVPVIVITALNYLYVGECIKRLCQMGIRRFMVNRYNIGGEGLNQPMQLSVGREALHQVFGEVNELASRYGLDVVSGVCTPHCLLDPVDYPFIRFGNCPTNVYNRPLTFDIVGNVRMCNHSPNIVGNVYRQPLPDILFSSYACSWDSIVVENCRGCKKWNMCRGGCRAASEQVGGTLQQVDPIVKELSLKPFIS